MGANSLTLIRELGRERSFETLYFDLLGYFGGTDAVLLDVIIGRYDRHAAFARSASLFSLKSVCRQRQQRVAWQALLQLRV